MTTWQMQAVAWLRGKAAEQAQNNERWPEHARRYPSWTERVKTTQRLADELEREAEEATDTPNAKLTGLSDSEGPR